eukprot:gene7504-15355_t
MKIFEIVVLYVFVLSTTCNVLLEGAILKVGNPLSWEVAKPHLSFIWRQGINQFIDHYKRSQGIESPTFLWGDEIEYGIFKKDNRNHFDLSLRALYLREKLNNLENDFKDFKEGCVWQPEYGNWMIEAIPKDPYTGYVSDLLKVEKTMQLRRRRLHEILQEDEVAPSITTFPMLGVEGYAHTKDKRGSYANSEYVSDAIINPHPRFTTLTKNIRSRRTSNVNILVPKDSSSKESNPSTKVENTNTNENTKNNNVHMDAMAFGMGCTCIQITMQCRSEFESRLLADQLAILSPLFLALSASSPIFHGHLVDTDTRWDVISQAVDDRTPAERGEVSASDINKHIDPALVGGGVQPLSKSRYSSASLFIGQPQSDKDIQTLQALNDLDASQDPVALKMLLEGGLDPILAAHVAHMFSRDPLVIFDDTVPPAVDYELQKGLDHFESIQSTNWRTVRWKPPMFAPVRTQEVPKSAATTKRATGPGWRVEFRPMEVQLTDFENAALAILVVLSARCLLAMGHSFYLPMSLVEENMRRSKMKNAIQNQKFYVRKCAFRPLTNHMRCNPTKPLVAALEDLSVVEMTLDEFFNGTEGFLGLVPAVLQYLDALGCDLLTRGRLLPYLNLLQKRASGQLPTAAQWIRNFIDTHPSHEIGNSELTPGVVDDLLQMCDDIGLGKKQCPELVGDIFIEPLMAQSAYPMPISLSGGSSTSTSDVMYSFDMGSVEDDFVDYKEERFNIPEDSDFSTSTSISTSTPPTIPKVYTPTSVCGDGDLAVDSMKSVHLDAALSMNLCDCQ